MKRLCSPLIWCFLLLFSTKAGATHLVGGFISYEYLGANGVSARYMVTITAYRDCKQGSIPLAKDIDLCIYRGDNGSYVRTENFVRTSLESVKPVGRTDCPELANVCLEKAVYRGPITLAHNQFGYKLLYQVCCRNTQVNLMNGSNGTPNIGQTYQAIIPSTYLVNSTPFFTDVPVPYICINDTTEINNYAIDPDGDSLVYKLATPWYGDNTPCSSVYQKPDDIVDYTPGYSSSQPFGNNGISTINSKNGVTTFLSRKVGNFATAIDVYEYRRGILKPLSITRLDLQIIVINCNPNTRPYITNATKIYSVYAGDKLCFDVVSKDKENNTISMRGIGDLLTGANGFKGTKATFVDAVAKSTVTSQFCWQTDCDQAATDPYLFAVQVVDDGCPSKYSLVNFYITVKPFTGKVTVSGPSPICQGSKNNIYTIAPTANTAPELVGITYNVVVTNGTLQNKSGNTLTISWNKNAPSGNIEVEPVSRYGCKGPKYNLPVTLIAAPPAPILLAVDTVCPGTKKIYTTAATAGYTYQWWVQNAIITGSSTTNNISLTWSLPGNGYAKLVQYNQNNCPSDTATLNVWVSKPATTGIIGPKTICPHANRIDYSVIVKDVNSTYKWFVAGGTIASQTGNSIKVNWGAVGLGQVKVIEINRFGCPGDTVYLSVDKTYKLISGAITGDTSICEFTKNEIYSVPYTNNSQYNWSITGGVIISGQLSNSIKVNWGTSGSGSLSVYESSYDSVNGIPCVSNPTSRVINIHPYPVADYINGDFEVCQLSGVGTYFVSGLNKSTYLWAINSDTSGILGQGTNSILYAYSKFGSFNFKVIETTEFGCVGVPIDTVLIVHPKPTTTPIIGDSIICYPNSTNFVYSVSGLPNSIYHWVVNGGIPSPNSTTNTITINWAGQQLNSIKVLEISQYGCLGDSVRQNIFYDNPSVYLNYITVNPPPAADNGIDVFWELRNAPRYNTSIYIERRSAGTADPFVNVGTIAGNQVTFNHTNINTDFNAWEYRVKGFDLCGKALYTKVHTNILLSGKKVNGYDVQMNFTPYIGWGNANIRYDVYRLLKNSGDYQLYESNVSTFNMAYSNGLEYYTQCYRIKATKIGSDSVTWSNDVCFDFDPTLFIPNAFSPNGDDFNNTFIMKGGALKSVEISIFNRWGEKLFVGNSLNANWDGTYKGKDQPQDVYMYYCNYIGFDGRKYSTKGTITLLR